MSMGFRTYKRRKKFLDRLAVGDSISRAAAAANGTTSQFRNWRIADSDFSRDWDEAIEEGTDFIEDVATERALEKSDPLMMMMLKARRPEKFDRGGKLELSGSVNVEGSKAKLLNKIARLQSAGILPAPGPEEELEAPGDKSDEEGKLLEAPRTEVPNPGAKRRAAQQGGRRQASSQ